MGGRGPRTEATPGQPNGVRSVSLRPLEKTQEKMGCRETTATLGPGGGKLQVSKLIQTRTIPRTARPWPGDSARCLRRTHVLLPVWLHPLLGSLGTRKPGPHSRALQNWEGCRFWGKTENLGYVGKSYAHSRGVQQRREHWCCHHHQVSQVHFSRPTRESRPFGSGIYFKCEPECQIMVQLSLEQHSEPQTRAGWEWDPGLLLHTLGALEK